MQSQRHTTNMSASTKNDSQTTHDQCLGEIAFITKSLLWFVKVKARQNGVKVKNPIPPTRWPTCRSTHHRHTTDTSANTLPTRWSTHYQHVFWHATEIVISFSCILFWAVNVMDNFFVSFRSM